jgi:hypothetical protein
MSSRDREQLEDELSDLKNIEDVDEVDAEESTASDLYSITSFGADLDAETLVKRLKKGQYHVPDFQRQFVWSKVEASKFIESLLLGLPVPGIFLYKESDGPKHLVIDGQQRLKSLMFYFSGLFGETKFRLSGLKTRWNGLSVDELDDDDRTRLECAIVHATIFKQDSPVQNMDSVYEVFERINTGGMKLSPQEIRSCVAYGDFNSMLFEVNKNTKWRGMYGKSSSRLKDIELILRFFAFRDNRQNYKSPMKKFLTDYMVEKRNPDESQKGIFVERWNAVIDKLDEAIGDRIFRPSGRAMNVAFFDSFTVATSIKLAQNPALSIDAIRIAYGILEKDRDFQHSILSGTATTSSVNSRFDLALASYKE